MLKKTDVLYLDDNNSEAVAARVGDSLNGGEICVIPTDTIYGVVAADNSPESVSRLYEIKGRPKDKPFIRLIGSPDTLALYTDQLLPENLRSFWPGPLTIIFRGIHEKTVAIRFPDDTFLKELFRVLEHKALAAPSANISGGEDIYDNDRLIETFSGTVRWIVCLKNGLRNKKASTIIDISSGPPKLVREGAVNLDLKAL